MFPGWRPGTTAGDVAGRLLDRGLGFHEASLAMVTALHETGFLFAMLIAALALKNLPSVRRRPPPG